jgi:hypothetical protein
LLISDLLHPFDVLAIYVHARTSQPELAEPLDGGRAAMVED